MSTRDEEIRQIRRQLGYGQGLPNNMCDMTFSVKHKKPEVEADPTLVPVILQFGSADRGEASKAAWEA